MSVRADVKCFVGKKKNSARVRVHVRVLLPSVLSNAGHTVSAHFRLVP